MNKANEEKVGRAKASFVEAIGKITGKQKVKAVSSVNKPPKRLGDKQNADIPPRAE